MRPLTARLPLALLLFALVPLGACGGGTGSMSGSNASLLTEETLSTYQGGQTAYEVIRQLRASWFNARRGGSLNNIDGDGTGQSMRAMQNEIQVYIDGARQEQGIDVLRTIDIQVVKEMRHLSGVDANMRFGADHGSGAILVTTKGD